MNQEEIPIQKSLSPQNSSLTENYNCESEPLLHQTGKVLASDMTLYPVEATGSIPKILAAMSDVIYVFDAQGRYLQVELVNPTQFYHSVNELLARRLQEVLEPALADQFLHSIQQVLNTQQPLKLEYSLELDHRQVWFQASILPTSTQTVIWIARDITEQKAVEQALREERNFVAAVLDTVSALIVVFDRDGRIIRFNRCCEQTTGYCAEEVEGQYLWELLVVEEDLPALKKLRRQVRKGYIPKQHENYWQTKDGTRRLIAWSNTALYDSERNIKYVVATGIDITEHKKAQTALEAAKAELEKRVEERTAALTQLNERLFNEILERKRAETELRNHKEHLEELVKARTAELEQANRQLRQEILERKQIEQALFQEKELAQVTLHSIGDAVITTDAGSLITAFNPAAERLTGWQATEAIGRPLGEVFRVVHEVSRVPVDNPIEQALQDNGVEKFHHATLLIAKNGQELAIDESVAPIRASNGEIVGVVLVFHDVTEERALARQLSWQARHDALTGLINRPEFEQHLKRALLLAQTSYQEHTLCYLDLDRFKIVNDTCGHVAGDELLRQVSILLQNGVRKADTVARLGGDEFAVLLHQCAIDQAERIAHSLRESIQNFRFIWQDKTFSIGVSIGLVLIDFESQSCEEILNAADTACYSAKEQGRNRVYVHQLDSNKLLQKHSQKLWISRIHQGFEDNRFCLYFQPIIGLQEEVSPLAEHFEVLLRFEDEVGELISPMAFIPAAERYNIMHTIDFWVIRTLFASLAAPEHLHRTLQSESSSNHRMYSINLSGATLNDDSLSHFLFDQFSLYSISPQFFCFEIPETVAITNFTKVAQFIRDFKELGCSFALDDFCGGISSFAYLKNLPIDYLKIDGSFVKNILENPLDLAMIESINRIAHVMGLQTIAEFVESDEILNKLQSLGIDYAQGYGIARPNPLFV